jgi:ParB-like nuclease domain
MNNATIINNNKPTIALDVLTTKGMQLREGTNGKTVTQYCERYREGADLEPITVFVDHAAGHTYLADGHHRVAAAKRAGFTALPVIIYEGTRRDALLFAAAANAKHGLPLTNDDKRNIVDTVLLDDEWRSWSDRAIAEKIHVSPQLVGARRKKLPKELQVNERKGKDGRVKNTGNIGKKPIVDEIDEINKIPTTMFIWNKTSQRPENPVVLTLCRDEKFEADIQIARDDDGKWYSCHNYQLFGTSTGCGGRHQFVSRIGKSHRHWWDALHYELKEILSVFDTLRNCSVSNATRQKLNTYEEKITAVKNRLDLLTKPEPEVIKLDDEPSQIAAPTGKEKLRIGDAVKLPESITNNAPSSLETDQSRQLKIIKKARAVLAETLRTGKHQWTGTDRQLVSLALVVGVPVSADDETWTDTLPPRAFTVLADRLKIEVADRLTSPDAYRLPPSEILAHWWSIDMRAATMTAERFL